jgi:hypothetical protein
MSVRKRSKITIISCQVLSADGVPDRLSLDHGAGRFAAGVESVRSRLDETASSMDSRPSRAYLRDGEKLEYYV